MSKKIQTKTIDDYLEKFPKTPSLTLARKIFNENVELFSSVESVRTAIRYRRGQNGSTRKKTAESKYAENFSKPSEFHNPYNLPESDEVNWEAFNIPLGVTKLGIMSDVHIPYHNIEAITACLNHFKEQGVNGLLLNGDILDFHGLSRFEKDPRKRGFSEELEMGRDFLRILKQEFNYPIYFKIGNHEARYEAYLKIKAPELLDVSEFKLDILLRFGELGVQLIESKQLIKYGKLHILHGHEFGMSVFSPVNPARGFYTRAKQSMLGGHHHQTSEHSEKSLNDDVVTCWSNGCLCELHPDYMPINKWNHGAAIVEIQDKSGNYKVSNFKIIKGKIY